MIRRTALLTLSALALAIPLQGCQRFPEPLEKDLLAEDRWADLDAQLDRRLGLAASLVATVKAAPGHEGDALPRLIEARARANLGMIGDDLTDPLKVAAFDRAEEALRGELARVLALCDKSPSLAADGAFRALEAQLADTEAAITRAREAYDGAARDYNAELARAPAGAVNKLTGKRFRARWVRR